MKFAKKIILESEKNTEGNSNAVSLDSYKTQKKSNVRKSIKDLSTVIYNSKITIENIPEVAYEYIVNGKPALKWVMDRQAITTDKASMTTNNVNDWAIEIMGNTRYPLELFLRIITVSLETCKIVNNLLKLEVGE